MAEILIYNSLSRKKEKFSPIDPPQVRMYCCGPTVYDFLHIGNFRGAVFYNFVRNWLEERGFTVTFVYNFTDVDDKILHRAKEEKREAQSVAEQFIAEFWRDFEALHLRRHTHNPRVTENIGNIIKLIQKIMDSKMAYVVDGEVFFSVRAFPHYGQLSGRDLEDMKAGTRKEVDEKKHDPLDFTLWKPAKEGEESWDSPWGKGRPGWHIECSAMNAALLGEQIDIHGGGMDLLFPHHENEIAQSEAAFGKQFSRYWLHNNMFTFDGQKMSKSLGNVRTMRNFLSEYDGEIFKFMVLSAHYRSIIDFSEATIERSISGLARIYSALAMAEHYLSTSEVSGNETIPTQFIARIQSAEKALCASFDDDFHTPTAFAEIFEVVRTFNSQIKYGLKNTKNIKEICSSFKNFIVKYGKILSLFQEKPRDYLRRLDDVLLAQKGLERKTIDLLVSERSEARAQKNFARSDQIRDQLTTMGISIQDTAAETHWEVSKS